MKILILSDTHHSLHTSKKIIEDLKDKIEIIIHLGDHYDDGLALQKLHPDKKFYLVNGNCDFNHGDDELTISIYGKKILLTHGHLHDVKWDYVHLSYFADEIEADIVMFGHTHKPEIIYHGERILFNPGSPSLPRGYKVPTYGMIEITENGIIKPSIVGIYKEYYRVEDIHFGM